MCGNPVGGSSSHLRLTQIQLFVLSQLVIIDECGFWLDSFLLSETYCAVEDEASSDQFVSLPVFLVAASVNVI